MTRRRRRLPGYLLAIATLLLSGVGAHWLTARPYAPEVSMAETNVVTEPERVERATVPDESAEASRAPSPRSDAGSAPSGTSGVVPVPLSITPNLGLDTENVLLIGIDRHKEFKRGGSTDTLIVAAFERESGHVALISVPRDLYVYVPDHGQTRINAVYGLARQAKQDPLRALERVIEDTLGLPITHSLAIDLQVFEWAIDAIGGIDVDVDCPTKDNFIDGRTESGRRMLDVEAGTQHMDGVTALMFVRSRHGRSDFGRARRQQAVLLALRRKLQTLEGAVNLPELLSSVEGSLTTHMSRLELLDWARRAADVDLRHLHGVVIGETETTPFRTERNWSVLLPDSAAIEAKLRDVFSARAPGTPPSPSQCPPADIALKRRTRAALP